MRKAGLLAVFVIVVVLAWILRAGVIDLLSRNAAWLGAAVGGGLVFVLFLPFIEIGRRRGLGRAWRTRLSDRYELPSPPPWWRGGVKSSFPKRFLASLSRTRLGGFLIAYWRDAGFDDRPLIILAIILFTLVGGYLLGSIPTHSPLLGGFAAFLALVVLSVLVYHRARMQRRHFSDQFPDVLDRLADSLQAGFSLPQAVDFVIPNLPEPSSTEMAQVSQQIILGFTIDEALHELYKRHPTEDTRLLVEGLTLQRQVGGDMPAMMREMASFVRERVKLENEVRTLTTQGRLSAVVIALLVPVSIGFLSMFQGYTDVLFQTYIGNLVLITAGILELMGAAIVARLVRIKY